MEQIFNEEGKNGWELVAVNEEPGLRLALRHKATQFLWSRLSEKILFSPRLQEKIWRQLFFYNAFKALTHNQIDGDYAEFGCWSGRTFALAYHESRRHGHKAKLWAFDSFQGLPSPQDAGDRRWKEGEMATPVGEFHALCASNGIPSNAYDVVPGFYEQTLATMSPSAKPVNIALAYIDCDFYSSTRTVLQFLMPRLKHGMILAFDDYFLWTESHVSGERRAMLEFFSDGRWALLPYMQFGWGGNSFVVEERQGQTKPSSLEASRFLVEHEADDL
jgi:O-methyltransferase